MAPPAVDPPALRIGALIAITLAAAAPTLLAYNVSPSPTFLNQALAVGLWGLAVALTLPQRPARSAWPLFAALGLLAAAAAWSWGPGGLPASLAVSAIGLLAAAAVVLAGGAGARARPGPVGGAEDLFAAFCWAWAITGALNVAVAVVQVFWPDLTDARWLASSGIPGRAVGNLRQPNHLSSVLLWGCIAVVALAEMGRLRRWLAAPWLAATVFAVVLTASRTGSLSVLLLALWGLLDRRLSRATRGLLLAAPLLYAAAWWALAQWAAMSNHAFGGAARLAETDISGSRFGIWSNTLTMIRAQPWFGVGFGEFNFAWTLTPFPGRPTAFFDHTHNLPLQLAVELGLPLAVLVTGLLLWALWRAAQAAWRRDAPGAGRLPLAQRSAVMMVLMIGLHSLLEYPLWYAYFLLPTAWAFGFAMPPDVRPPPPAGPAAAPPSRRPRWGLVAGLALLWGAGLSVVDYYRVAAIFVAPDGASSLEQRIASGQRSVFFAHHADYAAATAGVPVADPQTAFDRATHYLLDTRLMAAWARQLAASERTDAARHVAQRLREFDKADAANFFAICVEPVAGTAGAASGASTGTGGHGADFTPADLLFRPRAFQCHAPGRPVPWREFLPAN